MFGMNDSVGKAFFKEAKPDELFITSRFFTLQGEGPFRGHPAYFIRLAKCNLACSFCDTYFDAGEWRSFNSLLEEADSVIAAFFKLVICQHPPGQKAWQKNGPRNYRR